MKEVLWFLQAAFVYAVTLPVAVMPLPMALRIGSIAGGAAYLLWRSRRRIAVENLSRAVGSGSIVDGRPPAEIARESFRNLGRSLVEVIKLYHGLGAGILDAVQIRGIEHYRRAEEKGKGVILITGHCGNWELLALAVSSRGIPVAVVARTLDNPYLNRFIERVRKRYGNPVIYKEGALRSMISRLRKGGAVGLLIDQSVLPEEGVLVPFLGRPAWTMKSPALIARKTGAPVVPAFIRRMERGHLVEIHPEVELSEREDKEGAILEDTGRFTAYVEREVRDNPAEWLWIHRRWKRVSG